MSQSAPANAICPGVIATVKTTIPASYSGYGGRPIQHLEPGVRCRVVAVDIPKVRIVAGPGKDRRDTFVLVTFTAPDGREWDAGVNWCNLVEVTQ